MTTMNGSIAGLVPIIGVNVPTAAAISGGDMPLCCKVVANLFTLTSLVSMIETVAVTAIPATTGSPFGATTTPVPEGAADAGTSSDGLFSETLKLSEGTGRFTFSPSAMVSTKIVCSVTPGAKV